MKRPTTIAVALILAISMVAMPLAAADVSGSVGGQENSDDTAEENESAAPGEQLSGVVGVQEAELDGELAERTYGISIANAATDDAKADVVGEQLEDVEERIEELEDRADELNESHEAGEISQGQYESRMAAIAAEKTTAERLANGTAATAGELDEELLEERGIDVESIQTLADRASEIGGSEVAAIAQSIAGESVGQPVDVDRKPGAPIDRPGAGGADDRADADIAGDADDADTDADEIDAGENDEAAVDETDAGEDDETDTDEIDTDDRGQNDAGSQ